VHFFWIDAFAERPFSGNPAVVCVAQQALSAEIQQNLATEFNVSETVFLTPIPEGYSIRWFTPTLEVPLVGHATLAAACAILNHIEPHRSSVTFVSRESGVLEAWREGDSFAIELPGDEVTPCPAPHDLVAGLGAMPSEVHRGRHYMAVFAHEEAVANLVPNFEALARLDRPTIVATAPGRTSDYVLRFFAPRNGVSEDPVSGVAQCSLVPYWARRLDRSRLFSRQLSARGGSMSCWLRGERVVVCGPCSVIAQGAFDPAIR
jgi:predicted PhzF superfamily epimerase YddE/YHI9